MHSALEFGCGWEECNSYQDLGLNAALGPFAECRSRLSAGPRLRELDFGRNVTFVTLNTKSSKKYQIQQIQLATAGLPSTHRSNHLFWVWSRLKRLQNLP